MAGVLREHSKLICATSRLPFAKLQEPFPAFVSVVTYNNRGDLRVSIMLMSDVVLNGASVPLLLVKTQPSQPGQCAISLTCAAGLLSCMCLSRLEAAASHAAVKKISAEWIELLLCSCTAQLKSAEDAQRSSGPFSGSSGTCSSALQRHRGAKSE